MLKVESIENGTVIDHIRGGKGKKVLDILGLAENPRGRVALMINVPSKQLGKKDIVKIENVAVPDELVNVIALISPHSTINTIKNGKVTEKRNVEVPSILRGFGACPNPNCITNSEHAERIFEKESEGYRCHYCERIFLAEELV